jgi:hypothetical protein
MRIIGMFRRFSNSLSIHGRSQQKKPRHKTTTGFFSAVNAERHRCAIRAIHAPTPSFKPLHEFALPFAASRSPCSK